MPQIKTQPSPVYTLDSIKPSVGDDGELHYRNLEKNAKRYALEDKARSDLFYDEKEGSIEEESQARELASSFLVQTAMRQVLSSAPEQSQIWADRYTQASIELYGLPNLGLAKYLLVSEISRLKSAVDSGLLEQESYGSYLRNLKSLGIKPEDFHQLSHESLTNKYEQARTETKRYIDKKYGLNTKITGFEGLKLDPIAIKQLFEQLIMDVSILHPGLEEWEVVIVEGDFIKVSPRRKRIEIGNRRSGLKYDEALSIFCHEVLVHAISTINGENYSEEMQYGMPGYDASQEGLGIWFEFASTGELPPKAVSRYIYISIALGLFGGDKIPRDIITEFASEREYINSSRLDLDGENQPVDVKPMINRIYRGTKGDEAVGVFTKDILYIEGFIKIAEYIKLKLEDGYNIDEILEYMLSGKFDPTNKTHVDYVNKKKRALGEGIIQ